jgi:hypothetical protein
MSERLMRDRVTICTRNGATYTDVATSVQPGKIFTLREAGLRLRREICIKCDAECTDPFLQRPDTSAAPSRTQLIRLANCARSFNTEGGAGSGSALGSVRGQPLLRLAGRYPLRQV